MDRVQTKTSLSEMPLFTVTAPNLRIDVDSPLKLELVKTLINHADNQFKSKQELINLSKKDYFVCFFGVWLKMEKEKDG